MAAANPESCCIPGPSNVCTGESFINYDLFEHYGYDPAYPDDSKPDGHTDKEFRWFKDYPNDQHFEYDGMVLRGRVMANAYMREFSPDWANLTPEMEEQDAQILFPAERCPEGELPTDDNVCWMDQSLDTTPVVEPDCDSCTEDNDEIIKKKAKEFNVDDINGCSDVTAACAREDNVGEFVRENCCATCSGDRRARKYVRGRAV